MMNRQRGFRESPFGWAWSKLGDIAEINPKSVEESCRDDTEVTFLPMKCVEELSGNLDLSLTRKLSEVKRGYTPFVEGDLLFAKITPCMENGKVAIARGLRNGIGFGSTEFHVMRLPECLPRKFLFFFLIQQELRKDAKRNMAGTAGQLRVPPSYMGQLLIPVPPLPEQHRIVAKIEELFTKLDTAVEALNKVKAQLKAYRQAVLKYAFEGKLTADWREAHKGETEPASALLARIKEERRKNGEAKFKQLPPVDTADLPQLPEGWMWTRVGDICNLINGRAFKPKEWSTAGIPIIRIQNLNDVNADSNCCNFEVEEKYVVNNGQLLFAWSGTPGTSFGAHLWNRGRAVLNQHIFKVETQEDCLNKTFLMHLLNWNVTGFIRQAHGTAGLAHITKGKFEDSIVAIPPFLEQHKIVDEIERHFSITDEMEKTVEQGLRQAERMRQSILKSAFEGKLVPQDPSDEPAERLLERIREEKASRAKPLRSKVKYSALRGGGKGERYTLQD